MTKTRALIATVVALFAIMTTAYIAGGQETDTPTVPVVQTDTFQADTDLVDRPLRANRSRSTPAPQVIHSAQAVHKPVDKVAAPRLATRRTTSLHRSVGGSVYDITMYCPTGNRTASGKWPQRGMVATISRSIPFGTLVHIEGLGDYTVEDRIGHGSDFDLFTPSCAEANTFGRQHHRVTW